MMEKLSATFLPTGVDLKRMSFFKMKAEKMVAQLNCSTCLSRFSLQPFSFQFKPLILGPNYECRIRTPKILQKKK